MGIGVQPGCCGGSNPDPNCTDDYTECLSGTVPNRMLLTIPPGAFQKSQGGLYGFGCEEEDNCAELSGEFVMDGYEFTDEFDRVHCFWRYEWPMSICGQEPGDPEPCYAYAELYKPDPIGDPSFFEVSIHLGVKSLLEKYPGPGGAVAYNFSGYVADLTPGDCMTKWNIPSFTFNPTGVGAAQPGGLGLWCTNAEDADELCATGFYNEETFEFEYPTLSVEPWD